ncbi:MAG: RNA polymerase sigma factor [Planctomycetota bacterium]
MPDRDDDHGAATRFAELCERLSAALGAWVARHLQSTLRARVEVEDVLQEIWMRGWRLFDGFRGGPDEFRAWIFAVAKLVLLEVQRSARKALRVRIDDGHTSRLDGLDAIEASATALSQRVMRDENVRRFVDHLRGLSSEDQELVARMGLEGSPAGVVAARLGLGVEAVTKRWQRLRARLRAEGMAHDWLL